MLAAAMALAAAPLVVILGADESPGRQQAEAMGWKSIAVAVEPAVGDPTVKVLEAAVDAALRDPGIDRTRVYLAGEGALAAHVFYAASRVPHVWAAVIAAGSPRAAIDSNRLFAANSQAVPLYWIGDSQDSFSRTRLTAAGLRYEAVADWNAALEAASRHRKDEHPTKVDCETGNPQFPRCYWLEVTRFDPARRNDVLRSSRVTPGSAAHLALGGFGFDAAAPGPGVVVQWVPDKPGGPLRIGDRIVSLGGVRIADARDYLRQIEEVRAERATAIIVERGKERLRLETRIVHPPRAENVTARIQAERLPDGEILIVSRGVVESRLRAPASWTPATVNWNGQASGRIESAGCWLIAEGRPARPCP